MRLLQNQPADEDLHHCIDNEGSVIYSFQPILWPPSPGQTALIKLPPSISGDCVETFLTYVYTNEYSPPNPAELPSPVRRSEKKEILYSVSIPPALRTPPRLLVELYTLAKCYEISELTNLVARDLVKRIDSTTVWEILDCAANFGLYAAHVKTMAEIYIKKHSLLPSGMTVADAQVPVQRARIDKRPAKRVARRSDDYADEGTSNP